MKALRGILVLLLLAQASLAQAVLDIEIVGRCCGSGEKVEIKVVWARTEENRGGWYKESVGGSGAG